MPRIPQITDKSSLSPEHHAVFDAIAGSRGAIVGPFPTLLHSPEAAERVSALGHYLRFDSALTPMQREVAILTAARESDCDFEWAAHTRLGRQAGVREEVIEAIANRGPLSGLSDEEAVIVAYGRELLGKHRLSSDTYQKAATLLGERGVVDLTALFGYYTMIACVLNAFEVLPAEGAARLP
ncbi:MAG TPA: carboxymuconolactone decarboxylase family protein [Dehalococcoidia bacterium]|nr:carboxymuconolactone decarboxylase family protein [Dehalococcoidia bacterium]